MPDDASVPHGPALPVIHKEHIAQIGVRQHGQWPPVALFGNRAVWLQRKESEQQC
jgi:hypothetical protein